jgi:RNA polymerase sigma-70 factor (ECF subfamily)
VGVRLIECARAGDREALEGLVRATIGGVRTFLLAVSPPGTPVDDLVQETYLTAYERLSSFDPSGEGSFLSWVCGIGRNLLKRELRSRAGEARAREAARRASSPDLWDELTEMPTDLVAARADQLRKCLEELPDVQRELVSLRYGREFSFDQIARTLARTAGWARTTLHRARRMLKRCVEKAEKTGFSNA